MKILVIEDEEAIADALIHMLIKNKYLADACYDGESGLDNALTGIYDLIILDIMLPKINGLDVLKQIRNQHIKCPVILLTAKDEISDKVTGLDYGADDYITKPFSLRELLARIKAIFRRVDFEYDNTVEVMKKIDEKKENIKEEIIYYKDLKVDLKKGEIYKGEIKLNLTTKEFKLFSFLLLHKGEVLLRENIIEQVWKFDNNNSRSLDVHIRKLRIKLGDKNNSYLETIRGIGYMVPLE